MAQEPAAKSRAFPLVVRCCAITQRKYVFRAFAGRFIACGNSLGVFLPQMSLSGKLRLSVRLTRSLSRKRRATARLVAERLAFPR
jgi:hypothetical protein